MLDQFFSNGYFRVDCWSRSNYGRNCPFMKNGQCYDYMVYASKKEYPYDQIRGYGGTADAAFQDALLDIERQKLKASWKTASAPRSRNIGDIFK